MRLCCLEEEVIHFTHNTSSITASSFITAGVLPAPLPLSFSQSLSKYDDSICLQFTSPHYNAILKSSFTYEATDHALEGEPHRSHALISHVRSRRPSPRLPTLYSKQQQNRAHTQSPATYNLYLASTPIIFSNDNYFTHSNLNQIHTTSSPPESSLWPTSKRT